MSENNKKNQSYDALTVLEDLYDYIINLKQENQNLKAKIQDDNKIKHGSRYYDIGLFYEDYPEVAMLVKEMADKIYELIDKVNNI